MGSVKESVSNHCLPVHPSGNRHLVLWPLGTLTGQARPEKTLNSPCLGRHPIPHRAGRAEWEPLLSLLSSRLHKNPTCQL